MTTPAHPGRMLFVNIPVADLARSKAFFASSGSASTRCSSDETSACMLVGEHAFVMLLEPREVRGVLEAADRPIPPRTRWRCTASACRPATRSMRSAPLRSQRVAPRRMTPRTTASCTRAASSTSTATAGRSCGWTRRRRRRAPRHPWPPCGAVGTENTGDSRLHRVAQKNCYIAVAARLESRLRCGRWGPRGCDAGRCWERSRWVDCWQPPSLPVPRSSRRCRRVMASPRSPRPPRVRCGRPGPSRAARSASVS